MRTAGESSATPRNPTPPRGRRRSLHRGDVRRRGGSEEARPRRRSAPRASPSSHPTHRRQVREVVARGGTNAAPFRAVDGGDPVLQAGSRRAASVHRRSRRPHRQLTHRTRVPDRREAPSEHALRGQYRRRPSSVWIVATCRALGVPALAYLTWAFERLGTHRDVFGVSINELTPAAFKKSLG